MPETRKVSRRSLEFLARYIDIPVDELLIARDLIDSGDAYYEWEVPKASGGMRRITSPKEELKSVQRHLLARLLYGIRVHSIAHGFTRNRDIMTNARVHRDARAVFNLDLRNAFPSVRSQRISANLEYSLQRDLRFQYGDLISRGEIEDFVHIIVKLCTWHDCLPQGAPTSPALLNIVCANMDRELYGIAFRNDLRVTRYADDITFSSREREIETAVQRLIRATISNTGWKVNHKKVTYRTRSLGHSLEVTGLLLQENGKVSVPTKRRENYRAYLLELLGKDALEPSERARATGIIVYMSRVYGGHLPTSIGKVWGRMKQKFGFQDAPASKHRIDINIYAPEIIDRGEN